MSPAIVKEPPAKRSEPETASAWTELCTPDPKADHMVPSHLPRAQPRQVAPDGSRSSIQHNRERRAQHRNHVHGTLRGWCNYFQHSVVNVFAPEGQWVRQRPAPTAQGNGACTGSRPSTLAQCLLRGPGAILLSHSPNTSEPCPIQDLLTGGPDAGNPPVRSGGRGEIHFLVPTLIPYAIAAQAR